MRSILAIASTFSLERNHPLTNVFKAVNDTLGKVSNTIKDPHLTWLFADDFRPGYLEQIDAICMNTSPMQVDINGLGVFTGEHPVLYLNIVKTSAIDQFHRLIWHQLDRYALNPSPLYAPDIWMPHITVSYQILESEHVGALIDQLATHDLSFTIMINNLTVLSQNDDEGLSDTCLFQLIREG